VRQDSGKPIFFIHDSFVTTTPWKKMTDHLAPNQLHISITLLGHEHAFAEYAF
jgi:hypothetical protein